MDLRNAGEQPEISIKIPDGPAVSTLRATTVPTPDLLCRTAKLSSAGHLPALAVAPCSAGLENPSSAGNVSKHYS
jgi:hypothetical protein